MKKFLLLQGIIIAALGIACSDNASMQTNAVNELPANAAQVKELVKDLEQIVGNAKGRTGVSALRMETGERISFKGDEHFPMQSVYKLPIAMAVMGQVDKGKIKLDQKVQVKKSDFVHAGQHSPLRDRHPNGVEVTVEELLRLTVSESDGTTSDVLLDLIGGPAEAQKYLRDIGIDGMAIKNSEKEIGRDWQVQYDNWSTPDAAVELLRALYEGRAVSAKSRAHLLKLMTEAIRGEKRLKGLLPPGTEVAHRTGTSGTRNGVTAATNNIGIVTLPNGQHFIIAVFCFRFAGG